MSTAHNSANGTIIVEYSHALCTPFYKFIVDIRDHSIANSPTSVTTPQKLSGEAFKGSR